MFAAHNTVKLCAGGDTITYLAASQIGNPNDQTNQLLTLVDFLNVYNIILFKPFTVPFALTTFIR